MKHDAAALLEAVRGKKLYLLDMDGTLYLGSRLFTHSLAFLQAIRDAGAQYLFLTNNSSKCTDAFSDSCSSSARPAHQPPNSSVYSTSHFIWVI